MESENPMICIEDLEKNLGNASQRFDLITMVTSKAWIKNGKISVWIEDPQDHGITIMCSFMHSMNPSFIQDGFLRPNCQYLIRNALIDLNRTRNLPTFAKYQILLDQKSTIKRVKESSRMNVIYRPRKLGKIPREIKDPEGEFMDLTAIPVQDLGGDHPRRIILKDESGEIVWTLWDEDAKNDRKIEFLMGKCILIRNGLIKYFPGFEGEWQVKKPLESIRTDLALKRMQMVQDWYDQEE